MHLWRVLLVKQKMLIPTGHLIFPLDSMGTRMPTIVLFFATLIVNYYYRFVIYMGCEFVFFLEYCLILLFKKWNTFLWFSSFSYLPLVYCAWVISNTIRSDQNPMLNFTARCPFVLWNDLTTCAPRKIIVVQDWQPCVIECSYTFPPKITVIWCKVIRTFFYRKIVILNLY